jgi:hypothetical protein
VTKVCRSMCGCGVNPSVPGALSWHRTSCIRRRSAAAPMMCCCRPLTRIRSSRRERTPRGDPRNVLADLARFRRVPRVRVWSSCGSGLMPYRASWFNPARWVAAVDTC